MFNKTVIAALIATFGFGLANAMAEEVQITGNVQSRCIITTDVPGVFGNPNAYTLTTDPAQGGVLPVVRYDVTLADAYKAQITSPTAFTSSPSLPDVVTWTGNTEVKAVSDATGMGSYEANKVEFGNTDEYDLVVTGSTWFKTSATATMGGNKAYPGGQYTAVVEAVCIAK
jgi:hypothetical protein